MKKRIVTLLLFLLGVITLVLSACGNSDQPAVDTEASTDDDTFWVLTVATEFDQMKYQLDNARKYFKKKYPDREIKIEYLSFDTENELELHLTQLRTDIMAGNGPDVFILPTSRSEKSSISGKSTVYEFTNNASELLLFKDVNQAIHNGHFLDIGALYDADTELGKEGLNTAVMDAGIYNGGRYVLPLRYDLPVYMVDTALLEETGKDLDWLANTNVIDMMEDALAANDPILAGCAYPGLLWRGHMLSYFYDRFDYKTGNLNVTEEELTDFLTMAQEMENLCGGRQYNNGTTFMGYILSGISLRNGKYPIKQMLLQEALDVALMCKAEGVDYAMLPCRMADGSVVAHVTWYGAVGSSCNDPEAAYDFLRLFLTEEYQWEQNRPGAVITLGNLVRRQESPGMVAEGYPVRDRGASEYVGLAGKRNASYEIDVHPTPGCEERYGSFWQIALSDEDLPFLDFEIDAVRFPSALERSIWSDIFLACDEETGKRIYDSVDAAAKEMLRQIRFQLAEG